MKFSFIHTGDIHLGRPFSDLSEINPKTDICNNAGRLAFNKIIELALSKNVDFVLISGDSFDNDEHDLSAKLCFLNGLKRLAENGIKSYIICGNHDPIEMYKNNLSYYKNDGVINIVGVNEDINCKTFRENRYNIHALSFPTEELDNPVNYLPKLTKDDEKVFNIGLIHCDLDKTDSKYSPVSREELRTLGYDYYALGHIHIPEIKEEKIVYCGTPQARTKKETGAHGCYYAQVENKSIINLEFIPTDVVRFEKIEIDCCESENKLEVFEKISNTVNNKSSEVELTLYDITLKGVSRAYTELLKTDSLIKEYSENFGETDDKNVCVFRINNETKPFVNEEELLKDSGVIGILAQAINNNNEINIDNIYNNISELHEDLYKKLGIDTESKELLSDSLKVDKAEILENVKNELKSVCAEIYGDM